MTIMNQGMDACANFFRNGYIILADKSIATTANLTRERFEDIGWQVARQRYRSTEAREDFATGWLALLQWPYDELRVSNKRGSTK